MRQFLFPFLLFIFIVGSLISINLYIRSRVSSALIVYGNVDVRQIQLGFRVLGRLERVHFEEGDRVKVGMLMASLDKQPFLDLVEEAKAKYEATQVNLEIATILYERRKKLLGKQGVTQEEYENAEALKDEMTANLNEAWASLQSRLTDLRDTDLFSPIDGFVFVRMNEPGAIIQAGQAVYTYIPYQPVWIQAYATAEQLTHLKLGMNATITTDTPDGETYEGQLEFISPTAEFTPKTIEVPQLRTELVYALRIILLKPDEHLHDGMPATVTFSLNQKFKGGEK